MKLWLDTDLCPIIKVDTYGTEFQYNVADGMWSELTRLMTWKACDFILDALKDTESFKNAHITMGDFRSPREYNFQTDWIDFEIEFDDSVIEKYKDVSDDFKKYLKENYNSHSGYINFMPENEEEFLKALTGNDAIKFMRAVSQIIIYEVKKETDLDAYQQDYLDSVEDYAFGNGIFEID